MAARRSKRPTLGARKPPRAGNAGVARALEDHKRADAEDAAEAEKAAAKAKRDEEKPEKMPFSIPPDLAAEIRAASTELPPKAFGITLSGMVERAVRAEMEKLRRKWNNSEPFDTSGPAQVRKGRPPKG